VEVLLAGLVFLIVFGGILLLTQRSQRTMAHIGRHEITLAGAGGVPVQQTRTAILGPNSRTSSVGEVVTRLTRPQVRTRSAKLLLAAGSPMPLTTFLLLRVAFLFVVMPISVLRIYGLMGLSLIGIASILMTALTTPQMPLLYVKRKARKRAHAIEIAMPDALDLLVVCVEGGLSLDGGLQQVANRTEGPLAVELRRLQGEISAGMARRDAFQGLGQRSKSQSLVTFCSTIVQADKMGISIAATLRTLAETLRTRRRQSAETQARKAPIKMLPFLVFFMMPALFIVILTPAIVQFINFFNQMGV